MKITSLLSVVLLLSGCSFNAIEMAPEPTKQLFDLTDKENDGVITARDLCPDTYPGAEVNNDGCGIDLTEKIRVKLLVNFDNDSAVVDTKYYNEIKMLADVMTEYPAITVRIEGHTSIIGNASYNNQLSLNRADAVKRLLINQYNIEETRIETIGFGFEQLLYEGNNEDLNARNRRIVVEIDGVQDVIDMKWTIYSVDRREQ